MNGEETAKPVIKLKLGMGKRKKRDLKRKRRSITKSNSTKTSSTAVHGCPMNYERLTLEGIDICLRIGKTKAKKDLIAEFEDAMMYCAQDAATLLYFSDFNEALKIWKWLGKIDEYLSNFPNNF